jgi:hypothetical protein
VTSANKYVDVLLWSKWIYCDILGGSLGYVLFLLVFTIEGFGFMRFQAVCRKKPVLLWGSEAQAGRQTGKIDRAVTTHRPSQNISEQKDVISRHRHPCFLR